MDAEPPPSSEGSADLLGSLSGLSGLLTMQGGLERTLVQVATFARRAVPGADGAGLTLLEDDRPQTVVASAEFVRQVEDIQYALDEGPSVSAIAGRCTVVSGNLGGEQRWPHFGPRVGRLGIHSALSLPMQLPGQVVGALTIYARSRDGFTSAAILLGEAFAPAAAVTAANARTLAQAERLVAQLGHALVSRADIDQAVGVIMSRSGVDAAEAFSRLRAMSQSRSVRLNQVARELLDDVARRARARHTDAPAPTERRQ